MGLKLASIKNSFEGFDINLDLDVKPGSLTTLLGPSGCGKTTTLQIISGILRPGSGRIVLNGNDITDVEPWKRDIGIVFQDYALFPHLNVAENIAYGLKRKRTRKKDIPPIVNRYLDLVHLGGYGGRTVESLSGGEKQRVALARALAPGPGLLLLDEPLSALDASLRKSLRREIRRIQQELKLTAVYVTHDQEEALTISDRIVIMNNGRIEQAGTPEEVFNNPKTKFSAEFLGHSNLVPGFVKSTDNDTGITVELSSGTILTTPPASGFKETDPVWIFFRSGRTEVLSSAADADNVLPGKLIHKEFYGTYTLFEVEINGMSVKAESRNPLKQWKRELKPGEDVYLSIPRDHCYLIERLSAS